MRPPAGSFAFGPTNLRLYPGARRAIGLDAEGDALRKWLLMLVAAGGFAALAPWAERGVLTCFGIDDAPGADEQSASRQPRTAPSVVLVILDTVRADHLSACGYARLTSRFTQVLFSNAEFATCHAYSPGSWTLPSHASFFTGVPVEQHGADSASHGDASLPWGTQFTPLSGRFATLAEKFRERGYRTVLVSGNPVLNEASGLTRGFDHVKVGKTFHEMFGEPVVDGVRAQLGAVPPDEALFLVVNIADAHSPWLAVPDDLGWIPPRPVLAHEIDEDSTWARYVRGDLTPEQLSEARAHYADVYDYGVFRADRTLTGVFAALRDHHLLANDYRIVVTSDHGELLLEHDSFGHGGHLWEGSVRVPFLFLSNRPMPGEPREPFGAMEAHRLLLGEAPLEGPVTAAGNRRHRLSKIFGVAYPQFRERAVAVWTNERNKFLMRGNRIERYDTEADPDEATPFPVEDERLVQRLEGIAKQAATNDMTAEVSEELQEQLRALGYAH